MLAILLDAMQRSPLTAGPPVPTVTDHASTSLRTSIPILPRLTPLADATHCLTSCSSSSSTTAHFPLAGREADKRPAPSGLYGAAHCDDREETGAVTADAPHAVHSPTRPSSSGGRLLVDFHRQLTVPCQYGDYEAARLRSAIEAQYVHFLRCWQQRAPRSVQLTTGSVAPLIDSHSMLQHSLNQHTAQHRTQPPVSHSDSHTTPHRAEQQTHATRHEVTIEMVGAGSPVGVGSSSEAQHYTDRAVAVAVDEVRKSARKRRPPKLLAEEDDDRRDGQTTQTGVKRQRHGERRTTEDVITEQRPPLGGEQFAVNRQLAEVCDEDVVVEEEVSSQSEHSFNRPRRSATATRRRDVLLAHHFFRHFSLRCYSISSPPQPPPSSSASPANCSASVNYRLYMQSQAMLKAQFPKIGRADQPSTSYYACLCVEPASTFYAYCASLLPPRVQAAVSSFDDATPIVLSSSLFDLCDGLYFRILFFTSPYTTNGFATLLLAHLRLLAVRLHLRLIVCATRAQKQFWLSCGFRDAAQHWGGLNFGDTMLLACELMDEHREEEQRRRMAYKSEERVSSKAAHFNRSGAVNGSRRPRTSGARHTATATSVDGGKRIGFHLSHHSLTATAEMAAHAAHRYKRQGGKDVVVLDSKRGSHPPAHPSRPTSSWPLSTLSSLTLTPLSSTSSAPAFAAPLAVLDPLLVYHPYIVRSLRSGKLLPIRGPPLACRPSSLSSSPLIPSAAVMCVTQQSAYHKGGTVLLTFTLQRGIIEHEQERSHSSGDSSSNGAEGTDQRVWRVKLVQGKRGGGTVVDMAEQYMYPLGDGWRERYGLSQEPVDDAVREGEGDQQTVWRQQAVKDEEAKEEEEDSESEAGPVIARTRRVADLIDLVDDSDQSTNPTPDPLHHSTDGVQQPTVDLMDDDNDDGGETLDDRSLPFDSQSKLLSTPTLHATADTDAPPSPIAFPPPALDERSSPDPPTSPSPSPSPTLPSPLPSSHTARLQLILPMSPAQTHRGEGEVDGRLSEQDVAVRSGVDDDDDDTQPGQPNRQHRLSAVGDSKPHKFTVAYVMSSAFAVRSEGEEAMSTSIFAMMS